MARKEINPTVEETIAQLRASVEQSQKLTSIIANYRSQLEDAKNTIAFLKGGISVDAMHRYEQNRLTYHNRADAEIKKIEAILAK